jgi:hypothetical protein
MNLSKDQWLSQRTMLGRLLGSLLSLMLIAIVTKRCYRSALSSGEALRVIEEEVNKGWWDAQLFSEFRQMLNQSGRESRRFWKEIPRFGPPESPAPIAAQTAELKLR